MDIYDSEAVRAVWARVHPCEREPSSPLKDALDSERKSLALYRALWQILPQFRALWEQTLRAKERRCRCLAAMLYLQTGQTMPPRKPCREARVCPLPALREAYDLALAGAKRYEAMAQSEPSFKNFARCERALAAQVREVLSRLL